MIKATALFLIVLLFKYVSNGKIMISKFTSRLELSFKLKKNHFEYAAWEKNLTMCGIDEVGRGCLAGPVVAAAVVLPLYAHHGLLKDSKALTQEERVVACEWIYRHCWYGVGIINHRLIDTHNIWQATRMGMKRALMQLFALYVPLPACIVTDAMPLDLADTVLCAVPVYYFPKAEDQSASVAAASILAKVTRDRLISTMDSVFSGYNFTAHKGYGTFGHKAVLQQHHTTLIHRVSFLKKTIYNTTNAQSCIF
jgi:ribonuclease HII